MQCSHCLRRADSCPGGGRGKLCKEKRTRRGEIADYMRHLKLQHNYLSLKMKFRRSSVSSLLLPIMMVLDT